VVIERAKGSIVLQWYYNGTTMVVLWYYNSNTFMRNKHYKNRNIRLSEEVWEKLKAEQKKSGLSWNLFISNLTIKK